MAVNPIVAIQSAPAYVWDVNTLSWVPMTQPGGAGGGGGDASAANQALEIAALGATTDAEATGDGSIVAILKRLRTLLSGSIAVTGTFWQATQPVSGTFWQATQPVSGPLTDAQLRATAVPVSGTFWQATQPVSGPLTDAQLRAVAVPVSAPTLTKGTQGANGFSVQDLRDAGRTELRYYAVAVAAGTTGTETAISLTRSAGTAATSAANSHVITSGKRFRITSITVATRGHATATIQTTTFNLRVNAAGAVTTSSTPIVLAIRSATPATASAWDRVTLSFAEGWEIVGDGTLQFGITAAATYTTNAPTWDVLIQGYEY